MPSQEEIGLMARLAMLEQESGRELKRVRESYKSDYIGIPMVKNALRMTAVFLIALGIWAACFIDFILMTVAQMQTLMLVIGALAAYLMVMALTLAVSYFLAASRYCRDLALADEYERLLDRLCQIRGNKG